FPKSVDLIQAKDLDLDIIRKKFIQNQLKKSNILSKQDVDFLIVETNTNQEYVLDELRKYNITLEDLDE
ncbi:MAG: hypothetical protein KAU02_04610, partial [Tenericutes bacterium]|nr:hypothetical protein [Mycoplasmatota bacterium]